MTTPPRTRIALSLLVCAALPLSPALADKAWQKLGAACTADGEAKSLGSEQQKLDALARVVKAFKKVCVDEKGCAYYRGGYTSLKSGTVAGTSLDLPFADDKLRAYTGSGTTIVMMYECAGGKVAHPSAAMAPAMPGPYLSGQIAGQMKRPEGKDIVVWRAMNKADFDKQVAAAGGLRFGDFFSIGQQNWQHNFMYTGGRADVPFDWFEMGSSGSDGKGGTMVMIPGLGAPMGGMYAWPKGSHYFDELVKKHGEKKIFPVWVWRPYAFEACTSRSQCKDGQACHCTAADGAGFHKNQCVNANVCHAATGGMCLDDEHCPVGKRCIRNFCRSQ